MSSVETEAIAEKIEPTLADENTLASALPTPRRPRIGPDKTRSLYRHLPLDIVGQIAAGIVVVALLRVSGNDAWTLQWLAVLAGVHALRLLLFLLHLRFTEGKQRVWFALHTLTSFAAGITWGALATHFFVVSGPIAQASLLLIITAVVALAITTHVARASSFLAFAGGALAPWLLNHVALSLPNIAHLDRIAGLLFNPSAYNQFALAMFYGFALVLLGLYFLHHNTVLRHLRKQQQYAELSRDHADLVIKFDQLNAALREAQASSARARAEAEQVRAEVESAQAQIESARAAAVHAREVSASHAAAAPAAPAEVLEKLRSPAALALLSSIDNLLVFNRSRDIDEGESVAFSLTEFAQTCFARFARLAQEKGLAFRCIVNPDVPRQLIGDPGRISHVLSNIVENAVKYTEQGRVSVQISRGASTPEAVTLRFAVTDTGPGIRAEEHDHLFKPFQQGRPRSANAGIGLGLSVAHQLTRALGGELSFESQPGVGTVFFVALPVRVAKTQPPAATTAEELVFESQEPRAAPESKVTTATRLGEEELQPKPQHFVLVVEDNQDNQLLTTHLLHKEGYSVVVANNGREALEAVEQAQFDLILMDIQMPEMDGIEATKRIREREKLTGKHVPIIAVTAFVTPNDQEACYAAGMDDFVGKPISRQRLMQAINNQMQKRPAQN